MCVGVEGLLETSNTNSCRNILMVRRALQTGKEKTMEGNLGPNEDALKRLALAWAQMHWQRRLKSSSKGRVWRMLLYQYKKAPKANQSKKTAKHPNRMIWNWSCVAHIII